MVTVFPEAVESATARLAGVTDSTPLELEALNETVGGLSLSVMVQVPVPVAMAAWIGLVRLTVKVSLNSSILSPLTTTVIVWGVVELAGKLTVPLFAT